VAGALGRCAPVVLATLSACGPSKTATPPGPPPVPLHLAPACDLVPAAGLEWLVEARPRALAQSVDLIPAIATVIPEERFALFAASHGGVDLRQIEEVCVARYRDATLSIARAPIDPKRVLGTFDDRSSKPPVRTTLTPNPPVVRSAGAWKEEPQAVTVFGRDALAFEQGKPGAAPTAIRIAEAFALGKLKRASPALHGAALARAAEVVGDAPLRAFAPGPFTGETAQGLGGLLRASTAIAVAATPVRDSARISVRIVLTGAWGEDAPAAAGRLAAAIHVLSDSRFGKLFGLDEPLEAPRVRSAPEALIFEATYDANALARGVHDAVEAEVDEIMKR
jgi:hypothetical protein